MQAIALSGGVGRFGAKNRIQIHRKGAGSEGVLLLNYSDFESDKNLERNITLQPGDVIVSQKGACLIRARGRSVWV